MTGNNSNHGLAELSVLRMLTALGSVQGYDVVARVARELQLGHSDAYAVLYTLESRGLVVGQLEPTPEGGERRWYTLTARGRLVFTEQTELAGGARAVSFVPGGAV